MKVVRIQRRTCSLRSLAFLALTLRAAPWWPAWVSPGTRSNAESNMLSCEGIPRSGFRRLGLLGTSSLLCWQGSEITFARTPALVYEDGGNSPPSSDIPEFSAKRRTASDKDVRISFSTPWQVGLSNGEYEATNGKGKSKSEFVRAKVMSRVAADAAETLTPDQLLDFVYESSASDRKPEIAKVLSNKAIRRLGVVYRELEICYSVPSNQAFDIVERTKLSAVVVGDDLFVLAGTARESLWEKGSSKRLIPIVESFRVRLLR